MKKTIKKIVSLLTVIFIFLTYLPAPLTSAALTNGSITLGDSRPSATTVSYTIRFSNVTTSSIRCIRVEFDTNADGSGSKPTGMDITNATLSSSSNYIPTPANWSINNNNTTGVISITHASGETPASSSNRTVILNGITNGSVANTAYYVRFNTYNNTDCSSSPVDFGSLAFIYTAGQAVSATVDPTLSFTISAINAGQTVNGANTNVTTTSTTIPFGTLSTSTNRVAAHDLNVGTNAVSGYTVTTKFTGPLSNGNHDIADFTGTNASPVTFSSPGTEAFGYTTEDTSLGTGTPNRFSGGKWAKFTTSDLEVAYSPSAASETTRVGYQVGISSTTPAGSYITTVVFTATPTY